MSQKPAQYPFVPLNFTGLPEAEMVQNAQAHLQTMQRRRTVRDFSSRPIPQSVIEAAIQTAALAPSGANQQPWHFVAVRNPAMKAKIREAAEAEERAFYQGRAPAEWLEALAPLGTDWQKPFLEEAPWLIVVFEQVYGLRPDGTRFKHYYAPDSIGIATGFLITALHLAGVATLTHTPSPMKFLGEVLERPPNERAFMILVCGYPAEDAKVPAITKKPFPQIATIL